MKKALGALLLTAVLLAFWLLDLGSLLERLRGLGPAAFIAVYVLAAVLMVPGSLLTLGAGAAFGLARGFAWTSLASTAGATAAFLIGRYLARDWVAAKTAGSPRFAALDEAVSAEGWRVVVLLRLSPLFPFNLLNYALGLTRITLKEYVLASWVGMMPGTLLYVYLGTLAAPSARTPAQWALYAAGLAATALAAALVARRARRALERRLA